MTKHELFLKISTLNRLYNDKKLTGQDVISKVHALKPKAIQLGTNLDNYLYRNGILNRATAVNNAKHFIKKFQSIAAWKTFYQHELEDIKHSSNDWFELFGVQNSSHNIVKTAYTVKQVSSKDPDFANVAPNDDLDRWKVSSLLNSLLAEIYVGNYNEGSTKDLMQR